MMRSSVLSVVIALVLQGCVWPDDETLPTFIEAGELRNSLEWSFTRRREILDLANEELIGIPLDHSHNVFLSVTDVESVFSGVHADVSVEVFPDAWKEVAMMTGLNSPGTDECLMLIWMFYIERPVWYTASHGDLELLRNCMGHALILIQATPLAAASQGHIIARTLAGLMPVAFSAQAELRIRTKPSTAQFLRAPNVYFANFMAHHPRLMNMLNDHAATSPDMDDADFKEMRFAEWMGTGFRFRHHAAEFVDYHWSRLALKGEANKSIRLWKRLTDVSDEAIVEHETAKQSLMCDPFVHLKSKLNPTDSWELTVGPFLRALVEANGTEDIICTLTLDTIVSAPHMVPDLYKCIVEKLETGALRFPEEYPAENLATVMHMIRVSTSPTAYVVNS